MSLLSLLVDVRPAKVKAKVGAAVKYLDDANPYCEACKVIYMAKTAGKATPAEQCKLMPHNQLGECQEVAEHMAKNKDLESIISMGCWDKTGNFAEKKALGLVTP